MLRRNNLPTTCSQIYVDIYYREYIQFQGTMLRETRQISSLIDATHEGVRIDIWLTARFTYHSRHQWQNHIKSGDILINGSGVRSSRILRAGDIVSFIPISNEPDVIMDYDIIYEDDWLLVINKCGHLPCHPAGPFFRNTLWFELNNKFGKVHIANRLDRETSGLLTVAKNDKVAADIQKMSQEGLMHKEYLAIVFGNFNSSVNAKGWLIRDNDSVIVKKRRFVYNKDYNSETNGESAITVLEPVLCRNGYSLVKAIPQTGRMHQIRTTLYSLGFPLVGDKIYGPDDKIYLKISDNSITPEDWAKLVLPRQALHACHLSFPHPITGENLQFSTPLPDDMDIYSL